MDVGSQNYCRECKDRICRECGRGDRISGGGSWMSGHCFDCQWIVSRRLDAEKRRRDIGERSQEIAEAERRGAVKALTRLAQKERDVVRAAWLVGQALDFEKGADL